MTHGSSRVCRPRSARWRDGPAPWWTSSTCRSSSLRAARYAFGRVPVGSWRSTSRRVRGDVTCARRQEGRALAGSVFTRLLIRTRREPHWKSAPRSSAQVSSPNRRARGISGELGDGEPPGWPSRTRRGRRRAGHRSESRISSAVGNLRWARYRPPSGAGAVQLEPDCPRPRPSGRRRSPACRAGSRRPSAARPRARRR